MQVSNVATADASGASAVPQPRLVRAAHEFEAQMMKELMKPLHGGLSVNVISEPMVSQPNPGAEGTTQVVQQTTVQVQDKPVNRIDLKEGATVEDLVLELQRTGAGARDVISILQAMKEAGALEADLEVL